MFLDNFFSILLFKVIIRCGKFMKNMGRYLIVILMILLVSCNNKDMGIDKSSQIQESISIKSSVDFNQNGVDDYTDFLNGAIKDAHNHPRYDGSYVSGGYPKDDVGVCTDVIWRAFKEAGYSLKSMVDTDIKNYPEDYPHIETPDSNIDFRRVKNLHIFFEKYAVHLTTDIKDTENFAAGDIVIFKDDYHIGIISNRRNKKKIPYVIHNMGQKNREEDFMTVVDIGGRRTPIAHYRFDASLVDEKVLKRWEE